MMKKTILSFMLLFCVCHEAYAKEIATCAARYSNGSEFEYCEVHKKTGKTKLTQGGSIGKMYGQGWHLIETVVSQRDEYSRAKLVLYYFEK